MELLCRNNYIQIKPLKQGMIKTEEGNVYEVVGTDLSHDINMYPGSRIVVQHDYVILTLVDDQKTFFIKEENIIAIIYKETVDGIAGNDTTVKETQGESGPDVFDPRSGGILGT